MQSGGLRTKGIAKKSKENKPLLTVVTVVRNGENTLEQTILSVLNQTYDNIEYIIVDGVSTDGTLDIVKKYEDKIDYWVSEPDSGLYDAMNKGAVLASGDYVAMLNSDDWYEPNACEIIAEKIKEEEADIYHGLVRVIGQTGKPLWITGAYNSIDKVLQHPTCFISKKIYLKLKYNTSYKIAADYDFSIQLHKINARFCFIEKVITNFRNTGISSNILGIEVLKIKRKHGIISFKNYFIRMLYLLLKLLGTKIYKKEQDT